MAQVERHIRRAAQSHHHSDAPLPQRGLDILQPFQHELKMTQVGLGVGVRQAEGHQQGQARPVGLPDGDIEGMIVFRPLGLLHPVKHIAPLADLAIVQQRHAGIDDSHSAPPGGFSPAQSGPDQGLAARASSSRRCSSHSCNSATVCDN